MPAVICDRMIVEATPVVLNREKVEGATPHVMQVPAYTVPLGELATTVLDIWREYEELSEQREEPVSLGDFSLFLLVRASQEPHFQEV